MLLRGVFHFSLFQLLMISVVSAGSLKPLFFDSSKQQILEDPAELTDLLVSYGKVARPCKEDATKNCVSYDFVVPKGFNFSTFKAKTQEVVTLWNAIPNLLLKLEVGNVFEAEGLFPLPTDPNTVSGNFIISFAAPNEAFKTANTLMKVYNRAEYQEGLSEILHSTIYLKTDPKGVDFYSLIANGIGQSLGLGVSAVRKSVMADELVGLKANLKIPNDDVQWISYLYGNQTLKTATGILVGRITDGEKKSSISGAHIGILDSKDMAVFVNTLERGLLQGSAFSNNKGEFIIPSVLPGDYVLVAEPAANIAQGLLRFNPILSKLFSTLNFEPEFYDGAERESNHEAALGFSPLGIQYAATLHVVAGKETNGIEIITNSGDSKIEVLKATGSSNESISTIESPPKNFKSSAEGTEPEKGGGCSLALSPANPFGPFIFLLFFALVLGVWRRQGQRVK